MRAAQHYYLHNDAQELYAHAVLHMRVHVVPSLLVYCLRVVRELVRDAINATGLIELSCGTQEGRLDCYGIK